MGIKIIYRQNTLKRLTEFWVQIDFSPPPLLLFVIFWIRVVFLFLWLGGFFSRLFLKIKKQHFGNYNHNIPGNFSDRLCSIIHSNPTVRPYAHYDSNACFSAIIWQKHITSEQILLPSAASPPLFHFKGPMSRKNHVPNLWRMKSGASKKKGKGLLLGVFWVCWSPLWCHREHWYPRWYLVQASDNTPSQVLEIFFSGKPKKKKFRRRL